MPVDFLDDEEHFHRRERKEMREQRRIAQKTDRSKFKKTDQKKKKGIVVDHAFLRGRVVAITGEGVWVQQGEERVLCSLRGFLKKEKGSSKNLVTVGDWVRFARVASEGVIRQVEPRHSVLTRMSHLGKQEQLIAANVDVALLVLSLVEPPLKPSLVDRYLISVQKGGIFPVVVLNKQDLLEKKPQEKELYEEFLQAYQSLGLLIFPVSSLGKQGLEEVKAQMALKTSVVIGQSGVGKSSLLNACFGLELPTGRLVEKTSKGTHTTTRAELHPLPGGGYFVDTPGIRSFGIWQLQKEEVIAHFFELQQEAVYCKYLDCSHQKEPDCAVKKAVEEGRISRLRYRSFCTLLDDATGGLDQRTKRKLS